MPINYASAVIMNNLVLALNKAQTTVDYALASQEYALSYNSYDKDLQLLYGLSNIQPVDYTNIEDVLVFGKALLLSNLSTSNVSLPSTSNFQGFSIYEILGNIENISDAYIFGAIYLTSDEGDGEGLSFSLARPLSSPSTGPFIIGKDISLEEAKDIASSSEEIIYPVPAKDYSLEVYKFVADVDFYNKSLSASRVFIHLIDERKPRGYFGYTEESLAKSLTPQVIRNYSSIQEQYNTHKILVKRIISSWVGSSDWSPSFISYWQSSTQPLPSALSSFLSIELGINI